jgi:hypothetical protein
MPIKRKRYHEGRHKFERFEDLKSGLIYRRIYCGFAWPFLTMPGFICVLGEDYTPDHELQFSPRHMRVLVEYESSNLEELHRRCCWIRDKFDLNQIIGIDDTPLYKIWNQSSEPDTKIYFSAPYNLEKIDLNLISQLVRRHTERGYKTLHFGDQSRLPSYLSELTADKIKENEIQEYPPIAALGFCLSQMEFTTPVKSSDNWKRRNRSGMAI